MCASDDESCSALHDQDLSDTEWQIVEVSVCWFVAGKSSTITLTWVVLFGQESLPIFQRLADICKLLEGENYVLTSTYWGALSDVEDVLAPHVADSALIAALRQAMRDDHFNKRVTLENSLANVLHVLMTLLDPRFLHSSCFPSLTGWLSMHFLFPLSCCAFRWRVHRAVKLTADQWNRVKTIFLQYVPQFFPHDCMLPVFVPLNSNVLAKLEDLQQEKEELQKEMKYPAPATDSAHDLVIPSPATPSAGDGHNHPPPDMQDEQPQRKRIHVLDRAPAAAHAIDMDGAMQVEERKEATEERGVQWELAQWFIPAAPFLPWYAPQSQPDVQRKVLEPEFPRLALLDRRFLSIPPTSAPSERVWSRFGRVVSKQSSTIDSTIAAQIMFLPDNERLLTSVDPFDPASWFLFSPITVFDIWLQLREGAIDCILCHEWGSGIVEYVSCFETIQSLFPFSLSLHPHTVSVSSWVPHYRDIDLLLFPFHSISRFPFLSLLIQHCFLWSAHSSTRFEGVCRECVLESESTEYGLRNFVADTRIVMKNTKMKWRDRSSILIRFEELSCQLRNVQQPFPPWRWMERKKKDSVTNCNCRFFLAKKKGKYRQERKDNREKGYDNMVWICLRRKRKKITKMEEPVKL